MCLVDPVANSPYLGRAIEMEATMSLGEDERDALRREIYDLELQLQKLLLERAKLGVEKNTSSTYESAIESYMILKSNKLPGLQVVAGK